MIFKKIYLFLLSIFVLTFISCTQNLIFDSESENSNTCSVKFCVENFSDARTIAPEVLNFLTMEETEKNEYSFVLKYKKGRRIEFEEKTFDYAENLIINDLSSGFYTFVLELKKDDKLILSGTKTATLSSSITQVKFKLTPQGLDGNASVKLRFNINSDDFGKLGEDAKTTVKILKRSTNEEVNSKYFESLENPSFEYECESLAAGCYKIQVVLKIGSQSFFWQEDALYVEPGRETSAEINLPKLIYLPTWPEGSTLTATSDSSQIIFNWTNVYNAEEYELEIKEITDEETIPTDENTWNTAETISVINSCECIWDAVAGKKYVARVRAINNCGNSGWIYLTEKVGLTE